MVYMSLIDISYTYLTLASQIRWRIEYSVPNDILAYS